MTRIGDAWHTGFVVASVEEAIAGWSGVLATAWTGVQEYTARLRTPDGILDADMRVAFTVDGPHRIDARSRPAFERWFDGGPLPRSRQP